MARLYRDKPAPGQPRTLLKVTLTFPTVSPRYPCFPHVRRIFLNTVDGGFTSSDQGHPPHKAHVTIDENVPSRGALPPAPTRTAEVNGTVFASAAMSDSSVVQFFGMPVVGNAGTNSKVAGGSRFATLRAALRELEQGGTSAAGNEGNGLGPGWCRGASLRWEHIEELLFESYDPSKIFGKPPSTVSVASPTEGREEEVSKRTPDMGSA